MSTCVLFYKWNQDPENCLIEYATRFIRSIFEGACDCRLKIECKSVESEIASIHPKNNPTYQNNVLIYRKTVPPIRSSGLVSNRIVLFIENNVLKKHQTLP